MSPEIAALIGKLETLELELEAALAQRRADLRFGLERGRAIFEEELLRRQEKAGSIDDQLKARDDISAELERMSLLSEDIGKRMKAQELASTAQQWADEICSFAPESVVYCKRICQEVPDSAESYVDALMITRRIATEHKNQTSAFDDGLKAFLRGKRIDFNKS